jgi:peptide/nickel transport system substrate-binding protein
MAEETTSRRLFDLAAPVSRRSVLKRGLVLGASVPAIGSLLAACGDDETDDSPPATTDDTDDSEDEPDVDVDDDSDAEPDDDATADDGDGPRQGGELTVQGNQEIASLHPADAGPTVHWVIVANIHDPLIQVDGNYDIEPVLAESYEVADDGLSYTFNLHQGVLFHDGEEMTSADVKYTYEWYADPDNGAVLMSNFAGMGTIETPDDYTVVVEMEEVNASFLILACCSASGFILPEHHHSELGKSGYASDPIGTGPFKLQAYDPAEVTTLEAFDDYFRGRPNIDIYRETNVPEESVRMISLQTGESDNSVWPLTAEQNLALMEDDRFHYIQAQNVSLNHIPINNTRPGINEREVRQAMMHALNRPAMVDDLERGLAVVATANIAPSIEAYYEADVRQYDYDPDLANEMLDDAGWEPGNDGIRAKDGERISFTCTIITGDERNRAKAVVAQANLADVGIEMQINEQPVAAIIDGMMDGSLDASLYNWTYGGFLGEPDCRSTLHSTGARNWNHYQSDEMDELVNSGIRTTDPDERSEIYSDVQKLVAEDVPMLYLMFWDTVQVWNRRVVGVPEDAPNLTYTYRLIYTYWLEDEA